LNSDKWDLTEFNRANPLFFSCGEEKIFGPFAKNDFPKKYF
jgi:hypothetical protein